MQFTEIYLVLFCKKTKYNKRSMKLPPQGFFHVFHGFGAFDIELEGLAMNEKQFRIV
jgi:hypothetical protein